MIANSFVWTENDYIDLFREEADKEEHTHDPRFLRTMKRRKTNTAAMPGIKTLWGGCSCSSMSYRSWPTRATVRRSYRKTLPGEACSDDVCDEELKVMGRLVMADGFRKHASALGMTKEAFKKHLASIADKIKRESMDDED